METLPGFRFHPTEEELLEFYLKQVVHGKKLKFDIIPTVHLYRHDPRELPSLARIGEREWYFFVPRDGAGARKNGSSAGGRPSRTTEHGFWKATGSDRAVRCAADPKKLIGLKKTLVYYEGRAPRGTKTDWVMNEYRLPDAAGEDHRPHQEDVVLCKVYRKAVSLKELEQRVAMEELARCTSASQNAGSPVDSSSICSSAEYGVMMKKEAVVQVDEAAAHELVRPAMMRLPELEVAKISGLEWMQEPFLTQLRSPWMESWSPYYASSVLNF
uniref:NAC domain-containing protein n=1 Tax=Leersia perrieri TaxID=77586 RepID=A0A0D9WUB0_9ORYZ